MASGVRSNSCRVALLCEGMGGGVVVLFVHR